MRHITLVGMHKLLHFTVQLRPLHTFYAAELLSYHHSWRYGLVYCTLSRGWSWLLHRCRQDVPVMSGHMCRASLHAVIPPAASDVVRHTFRPAPARTSSQQMRLAQEAPSKQAEIAYLVPCVTHALFFLTHTSAQNVSSGSGKTIRNGLRYRARGASGLF